MQKPGDIHQGIARCASPEPARQATRCMHLWQTGPASVCHHFGSPLRFLRLVCRLPQRVHTTLLGTCHNFCRRSRPSRPITKPGCVGKPRVHSRTLTLERMWPVGCHDLRNRSSALPLKRTWPVGCQAGLRPQRCRNAIATSGAGARLATGTVWPSTFLSFKPNRQTRGHRR